MSESWESTNEIPGSGIAVTLGVTSALAALLFGAATVGAALFITSSPADCGPDPVPSAGENIGATCLFAAMVASLIGLGAGIAVRRRGRSPAATFVLATSLAVPVAMLAEILWLAADSVHDCGLGLF